MKTRGSTSPEIPLFYSNLLVQFARKFIQRGKNTTNDIPSLLLELFKIKERKRRTFIRPGYLDYRLKSGIKKWSKITTVLFVVPLKLTYSMVPLNMKLRMKPRRKLWRQSEKPVNIKTKPRKKGDCTSRQTNIWYGIDFCDVFPHCPLGRNN